MSGLVRFGVSLERELLTAWTERDLPAVSENR